MCTNGVNVSQFDQMIEQIDDHIQLERRWTHQLAHQAEHAEFTKTGEKLHEAQSLLDEVRALFSETKDILEDEAAQSSGVSVQLV